MSTSRDFRLYVLKGSEILEGDLAMGFSAFGMRTSLSRVGSSSSLSSDISAREGIINSVSGHKDALLG